MCTGKKLQLQFIYEVTFTRLYTVDSNYSTLLSKLHSFYPNVHTY